MYVYLSTFVNVMVTFLPQLKNFSSVSFPFPWVTTIFTIQLCISFLFFFFEIFVCVLAVVVKNTYIYNVGRFPLPIFALIHSRLFRAFSVNFLPLAHHFLLPSRTALWHEKKYNNIDIVCSATLPILFAPSIRGVFWSMFPFAVHHHHRVHAE